LAALDVFVFFVRKALTVGHRSAFRAGRRWSRIFALGAVLAATVLGFAVARGEWKIG
jgi:hypothetical protein